MPDEPADPPAPDMTETLQLQLDRANDRLVQAELKAQAVQAGIIDLDCLKMLDLSNLKLDEHGNIPGARTALANLKRDKPWAFSKANSSHPAPAPVAEPPKARMARDMTYGEWQAARERLIRGR